MVCHKLKKLISLFKTINDVKLIQSLNIHVRLKRNDFDMNIFCVILNKSGDEIEKVDLLVYNVFFVDGLSNSEDGKNKC